MTIFFFIFYRYKQGHLLTACAFVVMGTLPLIYRVIQNDCRCFNNLSYTIHFRQQYMYFLFNRTTLEVFVTYLTGALYVHHLYFYKHQQDNLKRIMYDKLLKLRQLFLITLYNSVLVPIVIFMGTGFPFCQLVSSQDIDLKYY